MKPLPLIVLLSGTIVSLSAELPAVRAAEPVQFNRDVRPILADACFHCHGPDPGARKADLRLDREDAFFRDGVEALVVRGNPEKSELYRRITATDPETAMPPPKAPKQLTASQKEVVRRWIAEGAQWQPHWSFLAPTRPQPPAVKNAGWERNAIDRFVLARLEAAGLAPAAEADPAALCRRLHLDLTGLPPTPEELDKFLAAYGPAKAGDAKAAESREKAYLATVDRLLESPQYAEHRARYWLDAARYADTHGLHFDNYREMWPYRDWVVQAFLRNQPFDQFTIEQFAGDLLPNPTLEQRIATGFHRCNITTNEGGTIAEENLALYARDRVETTAWVWLGLTANCCVCHDHKFDPLTMRDFYSMSAFFRNTTQGSHDGNIKDTKPILFLPRPEDAARNAAVVAGIAKTRELLEQRRKEAGPAIAEWLQKVTPQGVEIDATGLALHLPLNEGEGAAAQATRGATTATLAASGKLEWRKDGKLGPAAVLPSESAFTLDDFAAFERKVPFSVSLWVRPHEKLNDGLLAAQATTSGPAQGWELLLQQGGKMTFVLNAVGKTADLGKDDPLAAIEGVQKPTPPANAPKQSIRVTTRNSVAKPGQWVHLAAVYDGSGAADGLQLFVNGAPIDANRQGPALEGSIRAAAPLVIGQRANKANHLTDGALQDLRLYGRRLSTAEVRSLAQLHDLRADAAAPADKRNKTRLTAFYLDTLDPAFKAATQELVKLEDEQRAIQARSVVTHVQEEKMNSPAMANILVRGAYDKLGDKVTPAVFAALNPLPDDAPPNRLGLARWLVDARNPLTARVTMNRFWQELFGAGIVKSSEDFGIMGDAPSHPELLDWLAVEFRESGWDVRHMFRLMVASATYRQAATATPEKLAKDRDNRLLSRGPRFRMDAEMIRDYALAASGTLSKKLGGPSTRPYQPEGIWDIVGLPGGNTRDYKQDVGENLYRRSLYTFWKRMAPPPNMETFNAPSRELSCLRRERTNTPLQALVTLNDPQFVEASRNLAQAVLLETADAAPRRRLDAAARRILCRTLADDEAKILEPIVVDLVKHYQEHQTDAESLVKVGESKPSPKLDAAQLAAWTNVCNAMFNMDEALNK